MMKCALLISGLLLSSAALAQDQAGSASNGGDQASGGSERRSGTATQENGERLICRTVTSTTSRMSRRRECRTRQEWNDIADQSL